MKRPLFRRSTCELEDIFANHGTDLHVLEQLTGELRYRKRRKAAALRVKVIAQMAALGVELQYRKAPDGVVSGSDVDDARQEIFHLPQARISSLDMVASGYDPQPRLWDQATHLETSTLPIAEESPVFHSTITASTPADALHGSPLDEACKVLGVAPGGAWELVELARRQLVQRASPARTGSLSPEKRLQLQEQARRANLACIAFWENRTNRIGACASIWQT